MIVSRNEFLPTRDNVAWCALVQIIFPLCCFSFFPDLCVRVIVCLCMSSIKESYLIEKKTCVGHRLRNLKVAAHCWPGLLQPARLLYVHAGPEIFCFSSEFGFVFVCVCVWYSLAHMKRHVHILAFIFRRLVLADEHRYFLIDPSSRMRANE